MPEKMYAYYWRCQGFKYLRVIFNLFLPVELLEFFIFFL